MNDKWFRLYHDEISEIPAHIQEMKTGYWKKSVVFVILTAAGSIAMGTSNSLGPSLLGCFLAMAGVTGLMSLATMCHSQLCLCRLLKEIRKFHAEDPDKQNQLNDAA